MKKKWMFNKDRCPYDLSFFIRVMKLTTFFLLISFISVNASVYSQITRLDLKVQKLSVKEILSQIEDQSQFFFMYNDRKIDVERKVDLDLKQAKIEDIMKTIFTGTNTTFVIKDRQIVLFNENDDDYRITSAESEQEKSVSGRVTDSYGNTLPGVFVVVKGTTAGVITDIDGKFSLSNVSENATLQFSFVGMKTQEVTIAGKTTFDIVMTEEIVGMDEVVVVGYGTQKKVNLTGAVSTIDSKKLEKITVANTTNTLIGQLPGLVAVNRNGEPGKDDAAISIRGFNNMLVIVDGVEQSFNQIDPNEIESISVLKDASASIYGARAGNGVLLVKTKRGKTGKPKISFNAYSGLQSPTRFPEFVDAPTYARMFNDAEVAVGRAPVYSESDILKFKNGTDPAYPNTNWYKETFNKSAPISQYNLNTSGGSEQISYFFSLGYLNQDGLLKSNATHFNRYNLRSNIDAKISSSLSVSLDLSGRIEQRDYPGYSFDNIMSDVSFGNPTYPAYLPDPSKPAYIGKGGQQPLARSGSASGYQNDNRKFFNGILSFKYEAPFLKGLSAKAVFNYNTNYNYNKNWQKQISAYNYDPASQIYSVATVFGKNQLDENLTRTGGMTSQAYLTYVKEVGAHSINAMVVGEFITNDQNYFLAHREGYITTAIDQLFAGADLNKDAYGYANQDGRIGYAGRFNYSYKGKYLAEATMRCDASARYIDKNRWGYFPSVSLGWRISEESFLKDVKQIDNLKLRLSYGQAGNDYVGQFNYLTGYNFNGDYVFGETPVLEKGIISKGLANPDLTWEVTATSNAGVDATLWKGLLSLEFDYFYRKVTNVAGYRYKSLPITFGASLPQENLNSYDDRGFELVLGHKNLIGDFHYNISGNLTYARSKWIHFDEPVYNDASTRERLQVSGQWKNRWFGYEALGLFQSQQEIDNYPIIQDGNGNQSLKPGDIKYADYTKDGVLDYKDSHVIGRGTTPDVIFALNLGCEYKGFDLSMLWQGAANFNAYFDMDAQSPFFNGAVPYAFQADYWTPQNTGAKYPRMYPGGASNNTYVSTFWLQDASYVRLKNLQLGYTLPKGLTSKLKIENVRIYLSGYNILTIDKVSPYDPETGTGRGLFYPQQKSYSFGINITL